MSYPYRLGGISKEEALKMINNPNSGLGESDRITVTTLVLVVAVSIGVFSQVYFDKLDAALRNTSPLPGVIQEQEVVSTNGTSRASRTNVLANAAK